MINNITTELPIQHPPVVRAGQSPPYAIIQDGTAYIGLPYDGRLNKNKRLSYGRYGYPKAVKQVWDSFVFFIRAYTQIFRQCKKLDIDIMVYADDRSDPQNYITALSDIIQQAIGINDRYYHIDCDGKPDMDNPRFEITIKEAAYE